MAAFASECAKLKQELQEVKKEAGKHKKEKPKKKSVTDVHISSPMTDVSPTELLQQRCSALVEENMVCFCTKCYGSATLHNNSCHAIYMYLCVYVSFYVVPHSQLQYYCIMCAITILLDKSIRRPHSMHTVRSLSKLTQEALLTHKAKRDVKTCTCSYVFCIHMFVRLRCPAWLIQLRCLSNSAGRCPTWAALFGVNHLGMCVMLNF